MNEHRKSVAIVSIALLLLATASFAVVSAETRTGTSVSVGPEVTDDPNGTATRAPGETVTLTVWANATNVSGYQSRLTFDQDVIEATSVSGTSDFDSPVANVDNENGSVTFNQIRSGEATDPLLAEITFEVVGTDGQRSDLSFDPAETKLSNGIGETFEPDSLRSLTLDVESAPSPENETETGRETNSTPSENDTETEPEEDETETEPEESDTQTETEPEESDTQTETEPEESDTQTETEPEETEPETDPTPPTGGSSSDGGGGDDPGDDANANAGGSGGGATPEPSPSFHVGSVAINETAAVGETVAVRAEVRNGGGAGTYTARFTVNGTEIETSEIDIEAGGNRTVTVTRRLSAPGTYEFGLNGRVVGTTNVTEATPTPSHPDPATDAENPTATDRTTPVRTTESAPAITGSPSTTADASPESTADESPEATTDGSPESTTDEPSEPTTVTTETVSRFGSGVGALALFVPLALLVSGLLVYRRWD